MIVQQETSKLCRRVVGRLLTKDPRMVRSDYGGVVVVRKQLNLQDRAIDTIGKYGWDYFILEVKQLLEVERQSRGYYPPMPDVLALVEREFGERFVHQCQSSWSKFCAALNDFGVPYSTDGAATFAGQVAAADPLLDIHEPYPLPWGTVGSFLVWKLPRMIEGDSFRLDGLTFERVNIRGFYIGNRRVDRYIEFEDERDMVPAVLMALREGCEALLVDHPALVKLKRRKSSEEAQAAREAAIAARATRRIQNQAQVEAEAKKQAKKKARTAKMVKPAPVKPFDPDETQEFPALVLPPSTADETQEMPPIASAAPVAVKPIPYKVRRRGQTKRPRPPVDPLPAPVAVSAVEPEQVNEPVPIMVREASPALPPLPALPYQTRLDMLTIAAQYQAKGYSMAQIQAVLVRVE